MSIHEALTIGGPAAATNQRWTYEDLRALPAAVQVADVGACMPGRSGVGVRLAALLERARPRPDARHLHVASLDPAFAVSLELEDVQSSGIVVYALEGAPLDLQRGGPFRLLVPGHPDECVNVKALASLMLAAVPGRDTRPVDDAEHAQLHQKKK